jgi:hypothetical protein
LARRKTLTLVFAARDERHNDAVVLRKAVLGATSLIQRSMVAADFLTPRGHSRSTNMRAPSAAAAGR